MTYSNYNLIFDISVGELFLSLKAYKGEFDDELSFDKSIVLEVLNKVLDGWWIAR